MRYFGRLHAVVFCSLGRHETAGNWCPWCGTLVRPHAYAAWCVELADGTFHTVTAINEHHARSIVVHGGDARLLDRQGVTDLAAHVMVHPDNIVSCRQWADTVTDDPDE